MFTDPRFAPKRKDLPWLRRRRLPKAAVTPSPAPEATKPLGDFLTGHSTAHPHADAPPAPHAAPARSAAGPAAPRPAAASSSSSLDLDAPSAAPPRPAAPSTSSSSLDLDAPSAAPQRPAAPSSSSSSLDLDAPSAAPSRPAAPSSSRSSLDLDAPSAPPSRPAAPSSSSSLDLDDPPPRAAAPRVSPTSAPQRRRRVHARVKAGDRIILTPTDPTVTLTPLQSGIGSLTIEAAVSDEVGDLRLGCAYEFVTDSSTPLEMTMQMTQGSRLAPPHSKRPLILGSHDRFEKVSLDLRQCRTLKRLIIYAFSEGRRPLTWSGTLLVTTFGGGRIEVPLESLQGGQIAVLLSIYQVRGELVLRAEMQALNGDVREASRAYGYDRITWLDDRTPVE